MGLINVGKDLQDAGKATIDEAALKLDPMIEAAIAHALAGLKDLLIGRTITITIK